VPGWALRLRGRRALRAPSGGLLQGPLALGLPSAWLRVSFCMQDTGEQTRVPGHSGIGMA